MANVYSQFDLTVAPEQVQSRNVAVVMVSAMLPPFARPGDAVDVVVTSAGDARSSGRQPAGHRAQGAERQDLCLGPRSAVGGRLSL